MLGYLQSMDIFCMLQTLKLLIENRKMRKTEFGRTEFWSSYQQYFYYINIFYL